MTIRKAGSSDIPFITAAILEIETTQHSNTYSNLFGVNPEAAQKYLCSFLHDKENKNTELSLNSFSVIEIAGETAACSAHIYTDKNYYLSKSELFPIHLGKEDLRRFAENAGNLPDQKPESKNKNFIEYIFVKEKFRRQGLAEKMILHQSQNINSETVFINVMENKVNVIEYYKKLGFKKLISVTIDTPENSIYPSLRKIILCKNL